MNTGLHHIPKKVTVKDLKIATKNDLKVGLTYYTKDGKKHVEWMVRQRFTNLRNEETPEEYDNYRRFLLSMVEQQKLYIK